VSDDEATKGSHDWNSTVIEEFRSNDVSSVVSSRVRQYCCCTPRVRSPVSSESIQ